MLSFSTQKIFVFLSAALFGAAVSPTDVVKFGTKAYASTPWFEGLTSDDLDQIDPNLKPLTTVSPQDSDNREIPSMLSKPVSESELRLVTIQVLLDRSGFSPGAINGLRNDHLDRLIKAYFEKTGIALDSAHSDELKTLVLKSGGDVFQDYELTSKDIRGPFTRIIPSRIQDQGALKKLNFKSSRESIAERFHMDEFFLARMNPGIDFDEAGAKIKVTNIGKYLDKWVARIHADKELKQVTAFDKSGAILAVYPASIGSNQTPSPRGLFTVRNKAGFPAYTLAANNGFEAIDDNRQIVVAPGPNNPVGSAWIGLSKKTYGIHGTPEPSFIGRAESHGCIRLTNWDALELARLVKTGIEVTID